MRRASVSLAVSALVVGLTAASAGAAVYTVTLTNGTSFDSRYQPEYASWDSEKVVILTEFGNQVAIPVSEIQEVTVDTNSKGFGHQIDATTMALGWAPNDALDPESEEGKAALAADQAAAAQQAAAPPVYNQQQFVDPSQTSGMPVWMTGTNSVPQVAPSSAAEPATVPPGQ